MREKNIMKKEQYRTTTSVWIIFRKTAYRYRLKNYKEKYYENIPVCCQGYFNISGICEKAPCPQNKYGINCTMDCPCVEGNYDMCDINGTCLCSSGWTGKNCSQACDEGKYGEECKHRCSCRNNATCDHVTGICNCSSVEGKTGTLCDEECPPYFYGHNCSLACNCSDVQSPVCDSISGDCVCESGTRGSNCSEGCDLFHYGDGCAKNCSCKDTDVCDNEDGSCSPANICLATNTQNCLSSYNMTCKQVAENCNQSNTSEPSLLKDMQKLCCNGEQTHIVCVAKGGCECREQYAGSICNGTEILSSVQEGTIEESSAIESTIVSTIVPVVVSLLVIVVIALIVVAVMWRKRIGKIPQNVQNPGYGKAEPYTIRDKPVNATTQKFGQDNLEMYDANIRDVNDYGYDVRNRGLLLNQNENYSTTNFGEEYDHLQRNSHREEGIDDSYSHQHFLENHDEYSNVRTQVAETNNEYATTNESASKDNIYCNTQNNSLQRNSSSEI